MPLYNPEIDRSATADELVGLLRAWKPWLLETGSPARTNRRPFGFYLPSDENVPHLGPIPRAPYAPTRQRRFLDTEDVHFLVPRAGDVLGVANAFMFAHHGAFIPIEYGSDTPGAYRPEDVFFGIPQPHDRPELSLRAYRIVGPKATSPAHGWRYDVPIDADATGDHAMPVGRLTETECAVLAQVGSVCMLLYGQQPLDVPRES